MKNIVKVTVTGAAGQIGYALLFRLASGQMFGPKTKIDLRLLEIPPSLPALEGVRMELEDCAFPLLNSITCTTDLKTAMLDTNWALLVGAMPRKAGMKRGDLLEKNAIIFATQGKALNEYAAANVRTLTVGNPCNTNAYIAMTNAPEIPKERFFAMTALDEARAKNQLALKANVSVADIHNMIIWGNHSLTQYPDFYNAKIKDKFAWEIISDHHWLKNDFIQTIQQRGATIIDARGSSSAASAASAIIASVNNIENDTTEGEMFSLAKCSHGEYGIDECLVFSFPCITKNKEVKIAEGIKHNDFSQQKLNASLAELREEKRIVEEMNL